MDVFERRSMSELRSLVLFGTYLLIAVGSLLLLPDLIRRGWYSGDPGHITRAVLGAPQTVGITLGMMQATAVGVFVGVLGVMLLDVKKRLHAAVLLITAILLAPLLVIRSDFIPELFRTPLAEILPPLVVGIAIGVAICLPSNPFELIDRNSNFEFEFRRGAWAIHKLVLIAVVAMFVETTFIYPDFSGWIPLDQATFQVRTDNLPFDIAVVLGLWFSLRGFMQYDRSSTPFVVGPTGSGKTYFMIGALLDDTQDTGTEIKKKSQALNKHVISINRDASIGNTDQWNVDSTDAGQADEMWYTRVSSGLLPKNVRVNSLDYAGENLKDFGKVLADSVDPTEADESYFEGGKREDVVRLKQHVEESDVLILLLDAAEIFQDQLNNNGVHPDGGTAIEEINSGTAGSQTTATGSDFESIAAYDSILSEYGDNKRIMFAVTKADVLEQWFKTSFDLNIYREDHIDDFADLLYQLLRDHGVVRPLLEQSGADEVYPVYFRTELKDGQRVPFRPETGALSPFGFSRLMEDI